MIELTSANWRPLKSSEKFALFWQDLLHWQTHASLVLDSGITLASGGRSYLGSGGEGFLKIYGFDAADETNFTFFNAFLFPRVFHEDPRYIPLGDGPTARRFFYALDRVLVTRNDSGRSEFNKAYVLGTLIATSLSSVYYSAVGADVSVTGNFASFGINMGSQAAFNLLKEFWPELARKLNLSVTIRNLVRNSIRNQIRVQ
jgi:hypothetical protein